MNKLLGILMTIVLLAAEVWAEPLTREEQIRIITSYGMLTGQIHSQAASSPTPADQPPNKCGMSAAADFVLNYNRLDKGLLKSLGVDSLGRPTLPYAYGSPNGHFLIHYTLTGDSAVYQPLVRTLVDTVPDYVVMTARIADSVYTHIIDSLGYPAPPLDGFYVAGEDNRYDIYLVNLAYLQSYGQTILEMQIDSMTATSYMELDNDFQFIAKYAGRPLDAVRVTVAHEFFHAVQFGIDFTEQENYQYVSARRYWMEMSAVWMEEECYDQINDYYAYLPYFFDFPTLSLQTFGSTNPDLLHPYGAAVFPIYLSQRYGKKIIKDIWLDCAARGVGPQFLEACDAQVRAYDPPGGSLSTAINDFSIWNYFTGQYASVAPSGIGYKERANYPAIPIDAMLSVTRYPDYYQIGTGSYRPEYNGTAYVLLQNLDSRDQCSGCVRMDTSANPDTVVAISCDSTIPPHEDSLYPKSTVPISCDSVLPIYIGVQHPTLIEWGISVIYQLADNPDSIEINRFVVPLAGDPAPVFLEVDAFHPNKYKSIAIAVSPTSNNYLSYVSFNKAPFVGYAISDSGQIITRPSAVLTPYPNPAVVPQMAGQPVTFRFKVASDTANGNLTNNPLLLIDIYSVAGDFVRTINATFGGEDRLGVHAGGLYETTWDMKNGSGKAVASGVYLAYARLWETPGKFRLLAESKVKVALVR